MVVRRGGAHRWYRGVSLVRVNRGGCTTEGRRKPR